MFQHKEVWEGKKGEIVEKKSRFIAHVKAVYSVGEAQNFIEETKKKYWDARHNCSAFSIGIENPVTRCSDDGEPSGTAGKPILEVILGSDIRNVVIVVTRYFGGTLLGTGGLVRAYTQASQEGLKNSTIIDKIPGQRIILNMEYTDLGKVQYILAQNNIVTEMIDYGEKVSMNILTPLDDIGVVCKKITEGTSARVQIEKEEELYFSMVEGEAITFPAS